jgi:hypothetical protein
MPDVPLPRPLVPPKPAVPDIPVLLQERLRVVPVIVLVGVLVVVENWGDGGTVELIPKFVTVGAGMATSPLVPGSVISVEPSGTPTRLDVDAAVPTGAIPPELEEPQELAPLVPPPSKVESDPALGMPTLDVPAGDVPLVDMPELKLLEPDMPEPAMLVDMPAPTQPAVGPKPPGLTWTAPIGIPVGPAAPSGDVVPIAGALVVVDWAKLGPLDKSIAMIVANSTPTFASPYSFAFPGALERRGGTSVECLFIATQSLRSGVVPRRVKAPFLVGSCEMMPHMKGALFRKGVLICRFARS